MVLTESSNRGLRNFNKQLHLEPYPAPVKIRRLTHTSTSHLNWLIIS